MADKRIVSVPAAVVNMNPKQDRSWKLVFETRELQGDEVKILADAFQGEGWLVFKPNGEIAVDEIPVGDAEAGVKPHSQRLRNVIYRYWEARGGEGDFESFYRTQMEKLIDFVKSKID